MAYPVIDKPYGLKPINLIGGQVFAGSTRMFPIASGYNTSIFYGDVVELTTDGTIVKNGTTSGTSATAGIVGVFLGCEYSNTGGPIYGKNRFQYWLAGTSASDAVAYVCDDPDAIFRVAAVTTGTTIAYPGKWAIGKNMGLAQNAGSTSTGDSAIAVAGAPTADAKIMRVISTTTSGAVSTTQVGTTVNGNTAVTLSASNSNIYPYMDVTGAGIPVGTYVSAISGTSLTLSINATASAATTLTFSGTPELLVKFNFGWHSYYNATGAAVAS